MSRGDRSDHSVGPGGWATLVLLLGMVLVAASFLWQRIGGGASSWTKEKALAYQEVSARVHGLTVKMSTTPPEGQTRALQDELVDAQAEYGELRGELDAARGAPGRFARLLRYLGVFLAIAGGVGIAWSRSRTS